MNTGDLEPKWVVDIVAGTDTDFGTVESWKFRAYRETTDGKVAAFTDTNPSVVPGAQAWSIAIGHAWAAGQTDVPGVLHGVPVATWPGGREQSFPGAEPMIIGTDGD